MVSPTLQNRLLFQDPSTHVSRRLQTLPVSPGLNSLAQLRQKQEVLISAGLDVHRVVRQTHSACQSYGPVAGVRRWGGVGNVFENILLWEKGKEEDNAIFWRGVFFFPSVDAA